MSRTSSNIIPQTPPSQPQHVSPPTITILIVVILIFFFMGFFSIHFCKCFIKNLINIRRNPSGIVAVTNSPPNPGLDPSLIQSFPTFKYSTVKGFRREKYGLECAICLVECEDDDLIRLLTVCYHLFHQECIDLWLESHKTCPVCRRDLDDPPNKDHQNGSTHSDSISVSIKEDEIEEINRGDVEMKRSERGAKIDRFSRSHSTGHSICRTKEEEEEEDEEEEDRHRLRLKKHVKIEISRGQHHSTISCITFGDHENGGFGERSGFSVGDIHKL